MFLRNRLARLGFLAILIILACQAISPAIANAPGALALAKTQVYDQSGEPVVICLPGVYLQNTGNCALLGPAAYLTEMARKGLTFPLLPLAYGQPDPALNSIDYRYGFVRTRNAPVYGSLEDALSGEKKKAIYRIDSSFAYISYIDEVTVKNRRFYQIEAGAWMTANDVSRIGAVPTFQGVVFNQTPNLPFGWVLPYLSADPIRTKQTPGRKNADYTEHRLGAFELVQVFDVEKVGDEEWYMVGPDEWLPHRVVARVLPNPTPPQGVTGDRWIEINLYEQTLAVYDQRQLVFATLIASGMEDFWTKPGVFQIYQKLATTPMRGAFEADKSDAYYLEDVPWTMYYDQARALHGAYWRAKLGYPQSHGCVNLSVGDSHWLFNWANLGDWVYVWDPSGQTPTDPNEYSGGGY